MSTATAKVNFVNIPQELKANASFCVWRYEKRNGAKTKVPYNPRTGALARVNDPSTFADFASAMKTYAMGGWDGIGFRVSEGIGAIDIDHCIREDGSLNDVAASVLGIFTDAYFERSPSGSGLRGFFRLNPDFAYDKTVYYVNNRKHGLEMYLPGTTQRFVTVTGDVYKPGAVSRDDEALQNVLDSFMKRAKPVTGSSIEPCSYLNDDQVIAHASNAENGEKFKALYEGRWEEGYDSQSDADMALVSMLAFWCGNVEEQIDRLFRASGLMRDKWDRHTGEATYGQISIRNAVTMNSAIYMPVHDVASADADFTDLDGDDSSDENHAAFQPDYSKITLTLEEMQPHINSRYGREEIGIGNAFADYFKPIARFNANRGIWYVYDGTVWRPDEGNLAVMELAKKLADELYVFAVTIKDEDTRKRYIDRVKKLQFRKNRKTMVEDAKSVYPLPMKAFDSDLYLFNCQNGTLDLRTMEFHDHNPEEFHTKVSQVVYDAKATCPRWVSFIDEVMQGDKERSAYLQKALGYSLTGDTKLECLFILYGATSRNGKGTTMETFLKIMGEYGRNADPGMLAMKYKNQSTGGPSEEIARLAGSRFVNISEPEKKITLDAALTKRLTGNDTITARYLHENSFEFVPNFKIFINTNHLPNITDLTLFESGRIKIIPFNRHFEEHEQDKGLKTFFASPENLSGIFNWVLEGYRLFKAEKLDMPKSVIEATKEYHFESDKMGQFFDACLVEKPGNELRRQAVYTRYKEWCKENTYLPESSKGFNPELAKRFVVKKKRPSNDTGANATQMVLDVDFVVDDEDDNDDVLPEV